ncbi:TetR/AcrR family transcriptional regulator [Pseudoduganella sp. RAF53_2]|uniref:TetR/AcrR family transcriptional regulator n=1 Tax=unclassified Pseudoduganella TaxID=2637179 RepID=UPI003F9C1780
MTELTTQDKILRAARKLLEKEGAAAVSMRRVAEAVGITPMAIYRHFANREALLKRISDDAFTEVAQNWLQRAQHPDLMHALLHSMENYLDYALQHPHLFDYSFSVSRDDARRFPEDFRARRSPTLNVIADMLVEGMRQGLLREGDPWDLAMIMWGQAHGLISLYRAGRFSYNEAQFRAFYLQSFGVLFNGIKR